MRLVGRRTRSPAPSWSRPVLFFSSGHIVGVGHEAHVEHQIRLDGDAVLEAEGQDVRQLNPPRSPWLAEQVQQSRCGAWRWRGRRCPARNPRDPAPAASSSRSRRTACSTLSPFSCRGWHPASLLIAVDDGLVIRLQKQHPAVDAAGLQALQRLDKDIRGFPGADVVHQRHPVVPSAGAQRRSRQTSPSSPPADYPPM